MFVRVEVAVRPDLIDSAAQALLRKTELADPTLRRQMRWARMLDVYWVDVPVTREELIPVIAEVCWDRVLTWNFTGNLIPAAAGKSGGVLDLMEMAPNRPGKFWGIEKRFRPGVTDPTARTLIEAFEIVLGRSLPQARASSGGLFLLEGPEINEDSLSYFAREVFCNELIETWTLIPEEGLKKNDRFHQERVKFDLPRVNLRGSDRVEKLHLKTLTDEELEKLSRQRLWALSLDEMKAIRDYFDQPEVIEQRQKLGLNDPTDVEIEVLAQTWSEHCKHKIFNARIDYRGEKNPKNPAEVSIPSDIKSLFKMTISGPTADLPKPWLISVFTDNAGICAFDEEDAFCIKAETHNSPSALDPYGGALTGIVGVNRDILGCGLGAKPIFNTDVFCLGYPDTTAALPDRLLHPRRILAGVRRGVEHGGNKSGIPTVSGALVFDARYVGKPLVYCGTVGVMPRVIASSKDGVRTDLKKINSGDLILMVGGRIGKDGIHGATFSSLALDESSPSSAVQLGDPLTQKRMLDFLLEARDHGFYRALTDNGAGGLSSSVGELAQLSGGALLDVGMAKTKYPGLKPFELVISESQERMTVAVPPERLSLFLELAERRGVECSEIGVFNESGLFEILYHGTRVAALDLKFLHGGIPELRLRGEWKAVEFEAAVQNLSDVGDREHFYEHGKNALLGLLAHPNIASKEWMIRQFDHEVQGMSVVKPLHTFASGTDLARSGPNDGAVVRIKPHSESGLAVGLGINPKLSDVDPLVMGQAVVDEAVRNVLCVGAEFGHRESVLALVDNFSWPDPVGDSFKTAQLVRACFGMRDAALALSTPFVSGKDSMKNDFKGRLGDQEVKISVPPTLLIHAVGKVQDIKQARTSDFKHPGDLIYCLGPAKFGILGSQWEGLIPTEKSLGVIPKRIGVPDWSVARKVYSWIGGGIGKAQSKLKSLHDVSEGGLLVAIAEGLIARGFGASIYLPAERNIWEICFGEGFHTFVASAAPEDAPALEAEWKENDVPYFSLGKVEATDRLEVFADRLLLQVTSKDLRAAWVREGYWE